MSLDPFEAELDKPLEKMKPHELIRYIHAHQKEVQGVELSSSPQADLATMKAFQRDYGRERAAAILRDLFYKGGGEAVVTRDPEVLSVKHFSRGLRWWTDKVDLRIQKAALADQEVAEQFVFNSEI